MSKFTITEQERKRILGMHVEATKRHYGLIKEQEVTNNEEILVGEITVNFNPADYKVDKILGDGLQQLDNLINNTKQKLSKNKNKMVKIVLRAGESLITPPKEFPKRGDLSKARMKTIIDYLDQKDVKSDNISKNTVIGKEPYSGSDDLKNPQKMEKYREEQFFNVAIYLVPTYEITVFKFYIIKYTNATNEEYARMVTRDGQNSIINKTDYDYLRSNLKTDKYYKPEYFWSIIKNHIGDTRNTGGSWVEIQKLPVNSYYQVVFEEGDALSITKKLIGNLSTPDVKTLTKDQLNNLVISG